MDGCTQFSMEIFAVDIMKCAANVYVSKGNRENRESCHVFHWTSSAMILTYHIWAFLRPNYLEEEKKNMLV